MGSERLERYSKPASIRIQNADLPNGLPIRGEAKTTVDKVDDGGIVLQRRIYGVNGMATKDFDTTDHNLPRAHPMGAHKHEFDYPKRKPRGEPLPLTEEELKEHGDIIRRGENIIPIINLTDKLIFSHDIFTPSDDVSMFFKLFFL